MSSPYDEAHGTPTLGVVGSVCCSTSSACISFAAASMAEWAESEYRAKVQEVMTMTSPYDEAMMIADVRWQCRGCGRFIAERDIQEETRLDPLDYFGVSSRMWFDCPRCGPEQFVYLAVVGKREVNDV